jgi:BirA family biotin operon repressor/biotin-[acetyl-CoA-carboxylase] ligase
MINVKKIEGELKKTIFGKKIYAFETIDSTNNCARVLAECDIPEGTIVMSENQTQGRGRQGRVWLSERAKNLLFSIILRPEIEYDKVQLLTFCIADSILKVIEAEFSLEIQTKWPNDLLIKNKKFCGILLESSFKDKLNYVICGVGLNINQHNFMNGLSYATSLGLELNRFIDREELFIRILQQFETDYFNFTADPIHIMDIWRQKNIIRGKEVTIHYQDNFFTGMVIDVDNNGCLLIKTGDDKTMKFSSGDITLNNSFRKKNEKRLFSN